ncbi:MAG: diguanylate cyclase [Thermoleophilaceae bacterium]|jgi:diguanylate cyclase (GGDEF)-like protein|nr:diguanylate cyclase [Thermoleophilaceae bacterium]
MAPLFRRGKALARVPLVCVFTALLVATAGGGQAFWLCVPLALVLAAPARTWHEAAAGGALVTLAAAVPSMADPGFGPQPNAALIVAVIGGSVAVVIAVRARFEHEREALRRSALTDPLTGAANRRGLGERIEYEVVRHARQRRKFAVVTIDLDGFKLVNDRFGHHAGDELLRDVAASLREAVRDQDTVARLGGDEFCVLAPETDGAGGEYLAERVNGAIRRVTTGLDALSASVGVAVYPDHGTTPLAVLEAADAAQVAAKRNRRGRSVRRAA